MRTSSLISTVYNSEWRPIRCWVGKVKDYSVCQYSSVQGASTGWDLPRKGGGWKGEWLSSTVHPVEELATSLDTSSPGRFTHRAQHQNHLLYTPSLWLGTRPGLTRTILDFKQCPSVLTDLLCVPKNTNFTYFWLLIQYTNEE